MSSLIIPITPSLKLTSWDISAAPSLFALVDKNREHLSPWLPWVPFVKEVKNSEEFILSSQQEWEKKTGLELGIWYNEQLVGCLGLHELNTMHHKTSLGYWLGAEFQGSGIMTQAVTALIDWCFDEQNFHRVEIRAAVKNQKSRAIPERLGFVQEGIIRHAEYIQNSYLDNVVYGMLRDEWLLKMK